MRNFKDESFISQYLSPKLIREFRFFSILDDEEQDYIGISNIHDDDGYQKLRQKLSTQYQLSYYEPNLQVYNVNVHGDRTLTLRYYQDNKRPLSKATDEVLKHLHRLWGFKVEIETVQPDGSCSISHKCE